jgi:hypothetical protein
MLPLPSTNGRVHSHTSIPKLPHPIRRRHDKRPTIRSKWPRREERGSLRISKAIPIFEDKARQHQTMPSKGGTIADGYEPRRPSTLEKAGTDKVNGSLLRCVQGTKEEGKGLRRDGHVRRRLEPRGEGLQRPVL